jgi:ferritin-like metal-binding protein YciE
MEQGALLTGSWCGSSLESGAASKSSSDPHKLPMALGRRYVWICILLQKIEHSTCARGTLLPQTSSSFLTTGVVMSKEPKKLDELFHDTLKDIYFAEKKILATLPKMAKAAQTPELKAAFEKHRGETEGHVKRLEKVFAVIDKKPQAKTCDAIVGIMDEGAEIMKEYKGSPALDAGLLAAAQAVEHYEISRYGTMKTWAQELGLNEAVRLLDQTLSEEKKTDEALSKIAETAVNQQAQAA